MKMKRIITSVLAGAVALSVMAVPVMAQAKTVRITENKSYTYYQDKGWGLDGVTKNTYNSDGTTKTVKNTRYYEGEVTDWNTRAYSYDKKKRLVKVVGKNLDSTQDTVTKYSYGKNKETTKFYDYKGKYSGKDVSTYKYNGKRLKSVTSKYYDEKNKVLSKHVLTYSSAGDIASAKNYDEKGELYSQVKYSYKKHKLTKILSIQYVNGKATSKTKTTYTYKNGYTIMKDYTADGVLSYEQKYKTDKAGNSIIRYSKVYSADSETGKLTAFKTTYKNTLYTSGDGKGCLKESVSSYEYDGQTYKSGKETYKYKAF